jgi:hypothetical protein
MKKFLALAGIAAAMLFAVACDPNDDDPIREDYDLTIDDLAGTWEGEVEHDFAQGYYQKWRIKFEGDKYTTWHTHQMVGTINDEDQGLKTVGNKEKGTWVFDEGYIILTPSEQYASYAITSMSPQKYSYYEYNTETMESVQWYETSSYFIEEGIKRDLEDGTDWYIKKWWVSGFTENKALSVKINMDTFVLEKK